jgi:hypothetical protein
MRGYTHTEGLKKASGRSGLSNNHALLPNIDGRSTIARRFRDVVRDIVSDQGGIDVVAETRLQLIRRFAANCVLAEAMEAKMAQGMAIDVNEHCSLSGVAVRIAVRLGLNRRPRDVTTLREYVAKRGRPVDLDGDDPDQVDGNEN